MITAAHAANKRFAYTSKLEPIIRGIGKDGRALTRINPYQT